MPVTVDDDQPFDLLTVRTLLKDLVAGRGSVHWWDVADTRAQAILVPDEDHTGSCIGVQVVDEVATITAGLGARLRIAADSQDAETELVAVVAGILGGTAREYASIDETGRVRLDLAVEYEHGGYGFPVVDEVLLRRIDAWSAASA